MLSCGNAEISFELQINHIDYSVFARTFTAEKAKEAENFKTNSMVNIPLRMPSLTMIYASSIA